MDIAPADSPKTVTRSGSPPKAAMFVPHPREGGDLVEQPQVGAVVTVAEVEEAVRARAPVDRHADDAVAGEAAAVVAAAGVEVEGAAGAPDHHRQPAAPGSGVQMLRFRQSSPGRRGRRPARRGRPGRTAAAAAPARGRWRRGPRSTARPAAAAGAGGPDRRRRVRDAEEGVHPVGGETAHPAVPGPHDRGPPLLLARHAARLLHHHGGPGWRNSAESKVPMTGESATRVLDPVAPG